MRLIRKARKKYGLEKYKRSCKEKYHLLVSSRHVMSRLPQEFWLSIFPKTMELDGLTMLEYAPNRETNPLMLFRAISG